VKCSSRSSELRSYPTTNLSVNVSAGPDFCLAKYPSKFAAKLRQKYPRSRTRLYRQLRLSFDFDLNLDVCPDLNLNLNLNLNSQSYKPLLRQLFASSFHSMFGALAFDF
jgi:hypothetical protein